MLRLQWILLTGLAGLAAFSPVAAQGVLPDGWFLDEADLGGVIQYDLAYYDAATGSVRFSLSCTGDYRDVVVTAVTDLVDQPEDKAFALVLENDTVSVPLDGQGNLWNGRYAVGAILTMTPDLAELLLSRFSVLIDGNQLAEFTAETGREEIARVIEACQDRQAPGTTF